MNPSSLQQHIRFQIAQLSATNGQSDFEKICLHFARKRIHTNILPATGPVQAGGDQGRDFETFHSYLSELKIGSSLFGGSFSDGHVAFACSLEQKPTKKNGKIVSDVKSILKSGSKVAKIYFFSSEDIPVAHRHKCESEIKKEYNVNLEIIDGQGLALHLTDGDLYWVAVQYLGMSSELFPIRLEENWYCELLAKYKSEEKTPTTFEEFVDIKTAIRRIYKDNDLKKDLPFWMSKLDLIILENVFHEPILRNAIYEKFVGSLVGMDSVDGQEDNIRRYFINLERYDAPSELEDAQILLSFCINSKKLGRHNIEDAELLTISKRLEAILMQRIESVEYVDTNAFLIEIYANFIFQNLDDSIDNRIRKFVEKLSDILPLLPLTRYYPIEQLAERVNDLIRILLPTGFDLGILEDLAEKIDENLRNCGNKSAVADVLFKRAANYLESGDIFKALANLHSLKIETFNIGSLELCMQTCLMIASLYTRLHLLYAAKYFGFVAAFLSVNSKKVEFHEYLQKALTISADSDYGSGAWISYLNLLDHIISLNFKAKKDFDVYDSDDSERILLRPALIKFISKNLLPNSLEYVNMKMEDWGFIADDIAEVEEKLENKPGNFEERIIGLEGRPFNDLGAIRRVDFNAYSCNWHFSYENHYHLNASVEELVSIFQIVLAEFCDEELYFPFSEVYIEIEKSQNTEPEVSSSEQFNENVWKISLPIFTEGTREELDRHQMSYFSIVQALIYEMSLLPREEFEKLMKDKVGKNLISKTSFGRPYSELFMLFNSELAYDEVSRCNIHNNHNVQIFVPQFNQKLSRNNGIAPKYEYEYSLQQIKNRIDNLMRVTSVTLPILKKSPSFMAMVQSLRKDGWLDWQILHVIAILIANYKAQQVMKSVQDLTKIFGSYLEKDERECYVVIPEAIFDYSRIEQELNTIMPVILLRSFGLEKHGRGANSQGILKLLTERFNLLVDGRDIILF